MKFAKVLRSESGATAIEYGLIAGLIALGIVGALVGTRGSMQTAYSSISSGLANNGSTGSSAAASGILAGRSLKLQKAEPQSWGQTKYSYVYNDGSVGYYWSAGVSNGYYYRPYVEIKDSQTQNYYRYNPTTLDTVTNKTLPGNIEVVTYYPSGNVKAIVTYGFNADGTMTGTVSNKADTPQQTQTSTSTQTIPISQYQSVYDQYNTYASNP